MDFKEYLHSKKIDSAAFKDKEENRFSEWEQLFDQMNPASFTAQKLFLINLLRRKYIWREKTEDVNPVPTFQPKIAKPTI